MHRNTKGTTATVKTRPINVPTSAYQAERMRLQFMIMNEPRILNHHLVLADFYINHHQTNEAIKCIEHLIKQKIPANSQTNTLFLHNMHLKHACAYRHATPPQYDKAIAILQERLTLIKTNTTLPQSFRLLLAAESNKDIGVVMIENSQYTDAIEHFQRALKLIETRDIRFDIRAILLNPNNEERTLNRESQAVQIETLKHCANAHYQLNQYQEALTCHLKRLAIYLLNREHFLEQFSLLYFNLGLLYDKLGKVSDALECYQEALDECTEGSYLPREILAKIFYQLAVYNFSQENYKDSITSASSALLYQENDPIQTTTLYRILSSAHLYQKNANQALQYASKALALIEPIKNDNPYQFADSSQLMGCALLLHNQHNDAIVYFTNAVQYFPISQERHKLTNAAFCVETEQKTTEAREKLADIYIKNGLFDQAQKLYKLLLNNGAGQTGDLYFKQAICLQQLNELDKAIAPLRTALKKYKDENHSARDPHCAVIYINLVAIYNKKNNTNEAKINLKHALKFLEKDDGQSKIVSFSGYEIELNKNKEIACISLCQANICAQENKHEEALKYYNQAFEDLSLHTPSNYRSYALCLTALNKSLAAISYYEKLLDDALLSPDTNLNKTIASYELAKLYFGQGNITKAKDTLMIALSHCKRDEPHKPSEQNIELSIYACLGDIYMSVNELTQAKYYYTLSLRYPCINTAENHYKLASVLYSQNDFVEAEKQFKLALASQPTQIELNNHDKTERSQMALEEIYSQQRKQFDAKRLENIILPDEITNQLTQISAFYPDTRLTGSTVHTLLQQGQLITTQDLDFYAYGETNNVLNEKLKFDTCSFNGGNLYNKKENGFSIDLMIIKSPPVGTNPLRSRDFTICAISIDINGKIHSESKRGLDDFFAKKLDTLNSNPLEVFQHDSICLLRAIKYILRGFKPTPAVEKAMQEYVPTIVLSPLKQQHLFAVMRSMLKSLPSLQFIEQLNHYNLLSKLFNISNQLNHDEALLQLNDLLTQQSPPRTPIRLSHARASFHYNQNAESPGVRSREVTPVPF